jgi:TatD DNase family protein
MSGLIDSHCHLDRLDLAPFDNSFAQLIRETLDSGVEHMLCVCIDTESYPSMLSLVESYPNISISVGVHPNDKERHEPEVEELVAMAGHPKNLAIGETGLDYFRSEGDLEWQRERFRRHIRAAHLGNKPLIIHTRNARADTIKVMQEEGAAEAGGVMHCFTEDWEMASQALDMGFYISFSGIITFNSAQDLREVVKKVPLDRLLIETDAPYLAPVPKRGKPNYPAYVRYVAECVADVRGVSVDQIEAVTKDNFQSLFNPAKV